jgi:hypothetical protein
MIQDYHVAGSTFHALLLDSNSVYASLGRPGASMQHANSSGMQDYYVYDFHYWLYHCRCLAKTSSDRTNRQ